MFYRDHPQDIRHRTVQSRKPPPMSTHLIKGDPDSATSPSKYCSEVVEIVEEYLNHADLPADFAPYAAERPFRTLSTTESEGEAAVQKTSAAPAAAPQPKRKVKKKKKTRDLNDGPDETSALMSFLQTKDKNVSHTNIENFIHKSKTKYSVNEVRTAIENARNLVDNDANESSGSKWKKMAEQVKQRNFASDPSDEKKSTKTLTKSTVDSESKKRLKLISDARSAQKIATLLPEGYNPEPESPEATTPAKSSPKRPAKNVKGRLDSKQTQGQDSGQKLALPLQTYKKGKKPPAEPHSIEDFYRDFKLIFVPLPEPIDDLPCEYLEP